MLPASNALLTLWQQHLVALSPLKAVFEIGSWRLFEASHFRGDGLVLEGAVAAAVAAAVPAPQVIALGQHKLPAFHIELVVFKAQSSNDLSRTDSRVVDYVGAEL